MRLPIHRIGTKLLMAFLLVGLIPFTINGIMVLINAQNALTNNTISHLESIRDAKRMSIQQFFETQLRNVTTLAKVESIITATEMMEEAFDLMGGTIEKNTIWKALSERYTPEMKNYIDTFGYNDLYIISPDGDIVYSVAKKSDLGRNVLKGPLEKSPLGKCFKKTLKKGTSITDFELYKPHNNSPALFTGAVVKRSDLVDGIVVIYISMEMINEIMMERSGLGRTGETYLVGSDGLMRSDSFLDPANRSVQASLADPEKGRVETEASRRAFLGKTGGEIIDGYRGVKVVSAFTPVKFSGMTWALIAEIDKSEAFFSVKLLQYFMGGAGVVGIAAIILVSFLISRRISDPLRKLTKATEEISLGRLDVSLDSRLMESGDEIGLLAKSFHSMTRQLKVSMEDLMKEISERKRLTAILDTTSDMVSMATPDGRLTFMNQAGRKLMGWGSDEDISAKTIPDAHPEWALAVIKNEGIPTAIQNNVWRGETALLDKDGTIIPVSQVIMAHKSSKKEVENLSTIVRDISKRKQIEKALKESEEKYRSFIENAPIAMYTINTLGEFTYGNKKLLEMTGYKSKDWLNKPFYPVIHPEDLEFVIEKVRKRIMGQGTDDAYEIRIFDSSGNILWIKINSESIYEKDEQGVKRLVGMQSFMEDVTDRKKTEQALRQSEEKYRTVLETSLDPVIVYDIEGKVKYFNIAFTRIFGWTLEERLGRTMDLFVPEDAWPETKRMIKKVIAGENFSGYETRRYTKTGDIIHVDISAAIYKDQNGNPIGSVINLRDISEQKELEAQLQRAQKMEALGILAGGVAHDLNNVLSGIVSYPDLLLMEIPEDSPLKSHILAMQQSGKKAADIVQDLLTLARRGVVTEEVVDLNAVILENLKIPEYEKLKTFHPNFLVVTRLEPNLLKVLGSTVHLSKTVMNLLSNAAEAMPDGGEVVISTENRYIDKSMRGYDRLDRGEYVILKVSDMGVGISKKDKERIFEPFYTKKIMGRSGTGLGMAVVWGTVKDHKGYIDVQSKEGEGATFTLYFPATERAMVKEKPYLSLEKYMGNGESILAVDDSKEQREIVLNLLTSLGYAVNTVSSGEEAVEYMKKNTADLLLIDMIMDPGMDGLDTYKRIIQIHPGQKAIIASGFSETDRVKEAQKLGAGEYIKKPYTLERIGIAVRQELER